METHWQSTSSSFLGIVNADLFDATFICAFGGFQCLVLRDDLGVYVVARIIESECPTEFVV